MIIQRRIRELFGSHIHRVHLHIQPLLLKLLYIGRPGPFKVEETLNQLSLSNISLPNISRTLENYRTIIKKHPSLSSKQFINFLVTISLVVSS